MSLADVYYSDGYEEGWRQGGISIATRMLRMRKFSYEEIADILDLSLDEVESLAEELDAETAS